MQYPDGASLSCNYTGNGFRGEIECKTDREIDNKKISFEQTLIKNGIEEILLVSSFSTEDQVTCINAILRQATEKSSKTISFRQVNHYKEKSDGFSFYFIALISKKYEKGYNLNINMDLDINKKIIQRNANCVLEETVSPEDGSQVQGNFLCSLILSSSEQKGINISNIRLSSDNEEISGLSNLDEIMANPYRTDLAIKEVKEKKAKNEELNELADIVDYLEEKVELNKIFNIEYVKDADKCEGTGKFTLVGTFTDNIAEDIKFDLPLTYPNEVLKCELTKAKKKDKKEITCKASFGFKNIDSLIFEQRLIKKKNKEIIIIPNKLIKLNEMIYCIVYNIVKIPLVKQRHNSGISFLQINKFIPEANNFNFFLALTRKEPKIPFKSNYKIQTKLVFPSKRLLRQLAETLNGIEAECNLNEELQTEYAAGYDCANSDSFEGTPESMEIEINEIKDIQGIPDNANPDKLVYNIDYSILENLRGVSGIPTAEVQFVGADSCPNDGEFTINATLNQKGNLKNNYTDVEIQFAVPETIGICEIYIKGTNMNMTCQNTENIYITQIFIDRQAIKDSEGNEIFFIETFTNPEQFSCDISLNINAKRNITGKTSVGRYRMFKNNGDGLSGGAISSIVICIIIAIVTALILVILTKKGILFSGKKKSVNKTTDSTIERIPIENMTN